MAVTPVEVVTGAFTKQYNAAPAKLYRAPGRVNLIGEHTDYNLGFVLPMALDLACYVAASPSEDDCLRIFSENLQESRSVTAGEVQTCKPGGDWSDYVIGVAQQLVHAGYPIAGMNLAIYSTVPVGSGLSSSAAIEVSTAYALLNGRPIDKTELAKLAQRAEREFVGVPCGIMDQYISVYGELHKAVKIDCRSITHELVTLPEPASFIAVNSMVKHELGSSAYRDRVRECQEAVDVIKQKMPQVESLRDVKTADLEQFRNSMPEIPYKRARHVVSEDERVEQFKKASDAGDLGLMGKLFVASHRSLQHDYEVSAEELDYLVDSAVQMPGVYGARMTGGGFGGCTVNLVAPEHAEAFERKIAEAYKQKFGIDAVLYRCVPSAGAGPV